MIDHAAPAPAPEPASTRLAESITVVVATGNAHKVTEIAAAFPPNIFTFVPVSEVDPDWDAPEETGTTFEENAAIKALYVSDRYRCVAIADDSGLEVDALNGAPGVWSARYAGPNATDADNNAKLLAELDGVPDGVRTGRYVACIVLAGLDLAIEGAPAYIAVTGTCDGRIGTEPTGSGGFGYDPLFWPTVVPGRSMAQLSLDEKNAISHRGQALEKLAAELGSLHLL